MILTRYSEVFKFKKESSNVVEFFGLTTVPEGHGVIKDFEFSYCSKSSINICKIPKKLASSQLL